MSEGKAFVGCSEHPKWEWPHCGAPPADPQVNRTGRWIDPGDDAMPVPDVAGGFREADELAGMAAGLVRAMPELAWIQDYRVRVLWKARGGEKLGACVLATDLLKYFAEVDWIIWVAADHTLAQELTRSQVQALLYHELKHCQLKGTNLVPGIRKHDAEVFVGEVVRFGAWRRELEQLARAFRLYDGEARMRIDELLAGARDVSGEEGE